MRNYNIQVTEPDGTELFTKTYEAHNDYDAARLALMEQAAICMQEGFIHNFTIMGEGKNTGGAYIQDEQQLLYRAQPVKHTDVHYDATLIKFAEAVAHGMLEAMKEGAVETLSWDSVGDHVREILFSDLQDAVHTALGSSVEN